MIAIRSRSGGAIAGAAIRIASRAEIALLPEWRLPATDDRKHYRYYELVEDTIRQGFEYHYLIISDDHGQRRAVQPFFVVEQDLLHGMDSRWRWLKRRMRSVLPHSLIYRTMMIGCVAGEGQLHADRQDHDWIVRRLRDELPRIAAELNCSLIVFKEFPASYRRIFQALEQDGYKRVPSLPMACVRIDYGSFDNYMKEALSRSTRKNLRRKFRRAARAAPIDLSVHHDITPIVDELYPLYLQTFERSKLYFERLTRSYLCQFGQRLPHTTRFFVWRQQDRPVAFSVCTLHGDTICDLYLGLDYSIALDLHLYFYTLRDIMQWGMAHGFAHYASSSLSYDPKLHLGCELVPLDLYVRHVSPAVNYGLSRILPFAVPARYDRTLRGFSNYGDLWGQP